MYSLAIMYAVQRHNPGDMLVVVIALWIIILVSIFDASQYDEDDRY